MTEADRLASARVAVVGLGLMGGSIAIRLHGRCASLAGCDPDPAALDLARRMRLLDRADADPAAVLPHSDVVILAAPVSEILRLIPALPDLHPGNPVVLDIGSTKAEIALALSALPRRFEPVAGHPMTGKETSGLGHADPDLFQGAIFALVAVPGTTPRAREMAETLARALGAEPLWLAAAEHDRLTAATSHLPYLVAAALALATPQEGARLVGPGFCSASRLAASSPAMMRDVLASNRSEVLTALERFRGRLDGLARRLAVHDDAALEILLQAAAARRRELTAGAPPGGDR